MECWFCGTILTGGRDTFGDHHSPCCVTCWYSQPWEPKTPWYGLAPGRCGIDRGSAGLQKDGHIDLGHATFAPDAETDGMTGVYAPK